MQPSATSAPDSQVPFTHFAARGFWLPGDQAHFFQAGRNSPFRQVIKLSDVETSLAANTKENILDDRIFHRLAVVLAGERFGFTHAIPVYHSERPFGDDPDAAVFVRMSPPQSHIDWENRRSKSFPASLPASVDMPGLALLVNSSGFYLLLAGYRINLPADGEKALDEREIAKQVEKYLDGYLYRLVGGNFASRYSGWDDDAPLVFDPYEKEHSLKKFTERRESILVYDQINVIFEGLYNSALDPRVYFYDNSSEKEGAIRIIKRGYSLGRFVSLIAARITSDDYQFYVPPDNKWRGDRQAANEDEYTAVRDYLRALRALHPHWSHEEPEGTHPLSAAAHYLCHDFLGELGCGVILRTFLQASAVHSLQPYKRRVERCRRALVQEILEVTQHQDPLLQVEVPDNDHDRVPEVNEAQLRGYALLCSAKLPLLNNVKLYLTEIGQENAWFGARDEEDFADAAFYNEDAVDIREIQAALAMWTTLYTAVENDVHGLEVAIAQERQDMLVREEMKVRVEQETLAEIERLQQRDARSLSPRMTLTVNVLANLFAMASVAVTIIALVTQQLKSTVGVGQILPQPTATPTPRVGSRPGVRPTSGPAPAPGPTSPLSGGPVGVSTFLHTLANSAGTLIIVAIILVLIYFVAQAVALVVLRIVSSWLRRARIYWGERFYYEMDLHLEAPLNDAVAVSLLDGNLPPVVFQQAKAEEGAKRSLIAWLSRWGSSVIAWLSRWGLLTGFERNSYRIERMTKSEAMHKLYVEFTLRLPKFRRYRRAWRLQIILVYEFYYHSSSKNPRFILQDLRVISTTSRVLTHLHLDYIKKFIVKRFVNPLIPKDEGPWKLLPDDALMSLTKLPPKDDASPFVKACRQAARQAKVVRFIGLWLSVVFIVRGIWMALSYGIASGSGQSVLFQGDTIVRAAGLDEIVAFAVAHWWVALLPLGWVLLAGLVSLMLNSLGRALCPPQEESVAANESTSQTASSAQHPEGAAAVSEPAGETSGAADHMAASEPIDDDADVAGDSGDAEEAEQPQQAENQEATAALGSTRHTHGSRRHRALAAALVARFVVELAVGTAGILVFLPSATDFISWFVTKVWL